ncbi:MAG: cytochrome c biogenesis protein CcdA [Patescibacteria group bacterium]|nr:cytochrome c biogenesis protein CcdA [Patescibacteria group bacterium]
MDIIFSASIIAAFIAGMVALFAPCCITVLLPSYLASTFRERRNIVKMTFVFFAGISLVLVPIGLGAAGLAQLFRSFHSELYIAGGLLMVALAVMAVLGKGFSIIPMPKRANTSGQPVGVKSVFTLGVFSGAATSCCAPVLAGVVTLAVISGAFWKGLIVTFAYVFGMVFPLFISAWLYDKFKLQESKLIQGKNFNFSFMGKELSVHSTNLIAGAIFLFMGGILLFLGITGEAFFAPESQIAMGESLNLWSGSLLNKLMEIPDVIWGGLIIAAFAFFLYSVRKTK